MKKALHYFQKQALQYSDDKFRTSAGSLAPRRNHEPQQDIRHRSANKHHNYDADYIDDTAHGAVAHNHGRVSPPRTAIPSRISSNIQRIQYASAHILQSYELYLQPETSTPHSPSSSSHGSGANTPLTPGSATPTPTPRYWVVYIHGGYFRDPSCQASSFHATLARLTDPDTHDARLRDLQRHVRGYVSVNYRLAAHEAHPQDPQTTSAYERREAGWGEMLADVLSALRHWQGKYPEVRESGRYLLVGHSVGATLALNAVLQAGRGGGEGMGMGVTPPRAVLGVNGVYDFLKLHESFPEYEALTENAVPRELWEEVSPARVPRAVWEETWAAAAPGKQAGGGDEHERHRQKRWLLLAQSRGDGLVDWRQVTSMQGVFEEEDKSGMEEHNILCEVLEIKGRHNECWEDGGELARVVREGLGEVMGVDQ